MTVQNKSDKTGPFQFATAPREGGFHMDGYWVWCGSPVMDDNGTCHLFASRWPKDTNFNPHWLTRSEVVRATAKCPEGPYTFQEIVLPARGPTYWDGRMTHNPAIIRWKNQYLLFYTGTTYDGPTPTSHEQLASHDLGEAENITKADPRLLEAHRNQRIGLAIADQPEGPWLRPNNYLLETRPSNWDSCMITNPAPCVGPEDKLYLIYKSVRKPGDYMRLGLAVADTPEGPWQRAQDEPLFAFDDKGDDVEDPFLWYQGGQFHAIMKDMEGGLSGIRRAGLYMNSFDARHWDTTNARCAWTRDVTWDDGTKTTQAFMERPQLLINDGHPTHLFAATAIGSENIGAVTQSWTMVVPINSR